MINQRYASQTEQTTAYNSKPEIGVYNTERRCIGFSRNVGQYFARNKVFPLGIPAHLQV